MVVAIDGPAGSGKSTIARRVAEQAGFVYINSGNFYRAITYAALRAGADLSSTPHVLEIAQRTGIELRNGRISVDSCDVEQDLHSDAVDEWVALHSAIPEIRDIVNSKLRQAVENLD
ncbi:MAG TPA: (d)CMP kinase, partial [Spirochaetia bacterium]|nr:(d)CMP kinase [Spirochaetia bacterium]